MSIWSKLFGRSSGDEKPNALSVADWLSNMAESFANQGMEEVRADPSSPAMLVYFTLTNSILSTCNTLHIAPACVPILGPIYREYRLFYDCLWQLVLLSVYGSPVEDERISKLYGVVHMMTESVLETAFRQNAPIGKVLRGVIGQDYAKHVERATRKYIQGEGCPPESDIRKHNYQELCLNLLELFGNHDLEVELEKLLAQVGGDIVQAERLRSLADFEYEKCEFAELPNTFYKQFPKENGEQTK